MNNLRVLFVISVTFCIIGALNWGLVAMDPNNDLIIVLVPGSQSIRNIIYALIGLSGIMTCYLLLTYPTNICQAE
jgi:uncharacterized membrane protein YuzA (DUF378 family)